MAGVNSGCRSIVFPQLVCSVAPQSLSHRSKFYSKQRKNSVGEVEVQIHPLLMSALDNMRSPSRSGRFNPGQRTPVLTQKEGWLGPRADLDPVGKRKIFCLCRESKHSSSVDLFVASRFTDSQASLSISPQRTTRHPLDVFSLNLSNFPKSFE
jgi:hypothetical protein